MLMVVDRIASINCRMLFVFFFSSRRRHTRSLRDWSSDVCSSDLSTAGNGVARSNLQGFNGYGGFQIFANDAYSHYHSLQTTLSRRWLAGYFQAAYTWSKSTDATSSGNTALNTAFNDETDLKFSRGLSDFDRTHRFVVSYRY